MAVLTHKKRIMSAKLEGQLITYTSPGPNPQERRLPHAQGAIAVYQNSDNSRLFVECNYGGRQYTEEWEVPIASCAPKLIGTR
jgi:hypothetical protein